LVGFVTTRKASAVSVSEAARLAVEGALDELWETVLNSSLAISGSEAAERVTG